ncbi:MAG: Mur ligase family protein [Candidatus Saccharibacteria bacterium]
MRHYWTRFSLLYLPTIIYMLQGSDYRPKEYIAWLHRTSDFRGVMRRKKLDYTKKAKLLLAVASVIVLASLVLTIFLVFLSIDSANLLLAALAILLFVISPLIVAYGIVPPLWLGRTYIQEPSQRKMIKAAGQIFANHPAFKVAVAGSYGKTTAKDILRTVIGEGRKVAYTPGNMNTLVGISRFAQSLKGDEEVIIFELGEEKMGDVRELCDLVCPDIGVITGINEAHLSSFGTLERTVSTIFELKDYLGDKPLYKNYESSLVATKNNHKDKLSFSRDGTNGWRVRDVAIDIHGTTFTIAKRKKKMSVHTGLLGKHNIGMLAVAVDIADSLGLTRVQIAAGIEKTMPFEHRMQPRNLAGAWVIDDTYNGNSQGVSVGLELIQALKAKRRIYVTPGLVEQGDKTREIHQEIGRRIAQVADVVVLMNNSVTEYILTGLQEASFDGKLLLIDDPLEFYTNLDHFVASGDVVLMQNDWTDNYA